MMSSAFDEMDELLSAHNPDRTEAHGGDPISRDGVSPAGKSIPSGSPASLAVMSTLLTRQSHQICYPDKASADKAFNEAKRTAQAFQRDFLR